MPIAYMTEISTSRPRTLATLADTTATTACNVVLGKDLNAAVKQEVENVLRISGDKVVLVLYRSVIGAGGNL